MSPCEALAPTLRGSPQRRLRLRQCLFSRMTSGRRPSPQSLSRSRLPPRWSVPVPVPRCLVVGGPVAFTRRLVLELVLVPVPVMLLVPLLLLVQAIQER